MTRVTFERIGLGLILAFFLVLVTLIFSVLGTVSCAVLVGIMMGTSRLAKGQVFLVSLVFPLVILGLMLVSRAVNWHDSLSLSAICFTAVWIMYLLAVVLMRLEASAPPVDGGSGTMAVIGDAATAHLADAEAIANRATISAVEPGIGALRMDDLQGKWSYQPSQGNGEPCAKRIEVLNDQVVLSIVEPNGRVRCVARAALRLELPSSGAK